MGYGCYPREEIPILFALNTLRKKDNGKVGFSHSHRNTDILSIQISMNYKITGPV